MTKKQIKVNINTFLKEYEFIHEYTCKKKKDKMLVNEKNSFHKK